MSKYRYRFVELEELPEYDKEKYPFAVLVGIYNPRTNSINVGYYLFLLSEEPIVDADNILFFRGGYVSCYKKGLYESEWWVSYTFGEDYDLEDEEYAWCNAAGIIWTNFDIKDSAGKVYSKAVEPVPVYE